jgi:hypothetical protein
MIRGNIHAQTMVKHYLHAAVRKSGDVLPFIVLIWPSHIGKTTLLEQRVDEILWSSSSPDYLAAYDYSELYGKPHTFKIWEAYNRIMLELPDGKRVPDVTVREIIERLSLWSLWSHKIVFLENIDRMGTGAANAFLKTAEEPLPWRVLLATASNEMAVLETIRSRALIVRFWLPDFGEVFDKLTQQYPQLVAGVSFETLDLLWSMSAWRVGLFLWFIKELYAWWAPAENVSAVTHAYWTLIDALFVQQSYNATTLIPFLQLLVARVWWPLFLESLRFVAERYHRFDRLEQYTLIERLYRSYVSQDNLVYAVAFDIFSS